MVSRILMTGVLLIQLACPGVICPETRSIKGIYRNPALGYSIRIPHGLKGVTRDDSGLERGVGISLPSGGKIVVLGAPNSLEWKSPEEGVRAELNVPACPSAQQVVVSTRVGKLNGAKGSLTCGDRLLKMLLAFRSRGGPIYWLELDTTHDHESEDSAVLDTIAASFQLIRWE